MVVIVGIAVIVAMLGLSLGLALCMAVVARRADDRLDAGMASAVEPPPLADEPALTTRRFARDPEGRPIAAPQPEPTVRRASVASR